MNRPNYSTHIMVDAILLIDHGPHDRHLTITNSVETVVEDVKCYLTNRRLFYVDSDNVIAEIRVKDGKFDGFDLNPGNIDGIYTSASYLAGAGHFNPQIKVLEIRDRLTFIPALAVRLGSQTETERYLLSRAGLGRTYAEHARYVLLVRLTDGTSHLDPNEWGPARTLGIAHRHIIAEFEQLRPGAVVDVEFLLGEVDEPKKSERCNKDQQYF